MEFSPAHPAANAPPAQAAQPGNGGADVPDYPRLLAARDKTIAALKRRLMQEAQSDRDTPFALLTQNISLEQVVARKTAELEAERQELETALRELRSAQAQLVQAQKMESIGQLAAGVAHEINTPTQYVSSNIDFVKSATGTLLDLLDTASGLLGTLPAAEADPALVVLRKELGGRRIEFMRRQIPEALEQSLEGLRHIASIVAALKQFSHPSSGEMEEVDMLDLVRTTATVARNEWKYVADLEVLPADGLPPVPCIRDLVGQALLNLIVNAAHAIGDTLKEGVKEKGRIVVSAQTVGPWMELRLTDDGTGMSEETRNRMFDPFFTTKPVGKGTGQGLALTYSTVVDKHHGEIYCESCLGVGTTFVVRLPLRQGPAGEQACG